MVHGRWAVFDKILEDGDNEGAYQFGVLDKKIETVKVTSLAFTGESIAIIDKIVHGKFKISAATHEYCKCFDGFVS